MINKGVPHLFICRIASINKLPYPLELTHIVQ